MRRLTTNELQSETLHRVALRLGRAPSALDRDLIALIAEMIALASEPVPDCYTQATGDGDSWAVGSRVYRTLRVCVRCGGRHTGAC